MTFSHSTCRVQKARWLHEGVWPVLFERRSAGILYLLVADCGREGAFTRSGQPDWCGCFHVPPLLRSGGSQDTVCVWSCVLQQLPSSPPEGWAQPSWNTSKNFASEELLWFHSLSLTTKCWRRKQIQKITKKLKKDHCHFAKRKYKVRQFVFRNWVRATKNCGQRSYENL